ncbi:putative aldehyde dehydrogenase [Aspergillus keveii]|uniref:aldehyde dehydrogenase (NAD(+)) n=1 Tax=Aspergillus keveii TaxID=714993 RepID=A0ABR4G9E8_9EURO
MPALTLTGRGGRSFEVPTGLFISNQFIDSINRTTLDVYNPYSGALLGTVSAGESADIDLAVQEASKALPTWRRLPGTEKERLLYRLASLIARDADDFAAIHALDAGMVYDQVRALDIRNATDVLRHFAGWADKISGRITDITNGTGYVRREPFGVCGLIIPWNAPLMITCWKLGPALASGNVVIIKSPELAPLCGQKLGQLIAEAGFPPGVVNIVPGHGATAGQAIAEHMQIRKVSFTGSTQTGRKVLQAAASSNLKKVTLELGGKGASIVLKDADLANAAFWTSMGSSANNGQICVLGSRIYVQDEVYDDFVKEFSVLSTQGTAYIGNPLDAGVAKGPMISRSQHARVMSYIDAGLHEGAQLLFGGKQLHDPMGTADENHASGFIANTVFVGVTEDMEIVKEEIFGPVATIHRFSTEAEVIQKANASEYGLSASIFSRDIDRVQRLSSALEAGQMFVNCWGTPSANMPFGGTKASGFGSDMGVEALEGWTTLKSTYHWHMHGE